MAHIGIIGGSGLTGLENLEIIRREVIRTPYGEPSAPMVFGKLGGKEVLFLPRHGPGHTIPPHQINYRANIWALKEVGVSKVIAVAAVGAITNLEPSLILVPDQIIDYTNGREHTFFDRDSGQVKHVDFTNPYCQELREEIIKSIKLSGIKGVYHGTYGATQGPRFETAAEIKMLEKDGADIVGMTGMPEAALARELELCYATIAVSANPAAGKSKQEIDIKQVEKNLQTGMKLVRKILEHAIPVISKK
jgi:5'-deoxy-5'-methylthioadenosine phosphorylase